VKLTIDIENTVQRLPTGKLMLDPFTEGNQLVLVCAKTDTGQEHSFWFNHCTHSTDNAHSLLQSLLDNATILICHNAQHELTWLWETGFKYDGPVFDTMLVEYLFQRGVKQPLSLQAVAERYELDNQKMSTLKDSFDQGLSVDEIEGDSLLEYCMADVRATQELSNKLRIKMYGDYKCLHHIIELTNDLCVLLSKIYCRGFTVDKKQLDTVRMEFKLEQNTIRRELDKQVSELMGDTPINLSSPEQLSMVVYSRKPTDKSTWSASFSKYMNNKDFKNQVEKNSEVVYKTRAIQCKECLGVGYTLARKKDGTVGKAKRICSVCNKAGIVYVDTNKIAGLKFSAPSASWVANHGFSTSKTNIEILEETAKRKGMQDAESFLYKVRRLSALDTYISAFVDGINLFTKSDGKLHVRLVQHRTSTGRLSSDSPNLQNMPRGNTFPIKKVFRSRWPEGSILEADFAQLEFRAAAFLSDDEVAKQEIETGFDVHSYTAKVITDSGQIISRQEAKAHTFAPLFGATGFGRSRSEAMYYQQFTKKYGGIAKWHSKLANEVMSTGMVTTATGRQFAFPNAERRNGGGITHFTAVKNYPVQSISTDVVQLTLLLTEKLMRRNDLKSVIVNTVHDSIVIDVHPSEVEAVKNTVEEVEKILRESFLYTFEVDFSIPLILESKIGKNWMDLQELV